MQTSSAIFVCAGDTFYDRWCRVLRLLLYTSDVVELAALQS